MSGLIYNLLLIAALPGAAAYFLWRVFVSRKSSNSWRQNLGALPPLANREPGRNLIWLHAVSVGETVASLPIQEELRRLLPDALILVTTITQTGNEVARKSAKHADEVAYFPVDYPICVNRALDRVRPDAVVIMEAEFWPNFLSAARNRGIPTVLVNGRVSDRTMSRSRTWRWLTSWATSNLDHCCMQTKADAERILEMGACPDAVRVFGNTKFDQDGAQLSGDAVMELREGFGLPDGVPAFVAGSTNPGEDEPVLSAFARMREKVKTLRLIIAPRQVERGEEIRAMAEAMGLKAVRRSQKDDRPTEYDVLVLDTFGELATAYAAGEIAFVGGTLIPKGGHSLFQPILQGKPVLFGPHTFKTRDMAQMAIAAGVGFEIQGADELAERGLSLLQDESRRAEIDAACRGMVEENRGASARCAELIAGLLRTEPGGRDVS